MAGSEENNSAPQEGLPAPSKARIKNFACKNCGASVTVKYAGATLAVTCQSCQSVIDVTDENYRILSEYGKGISPEQLIPLGSRGVFFKVLWEVIGFMIREDVGSGYTWQEYLLFNPYHGYRWLTQAKGHWNFVTPIKEKPVRGANEVEFHKKFRLYYDGRAKVRYVLGEFYWKVRVGQQVKMSDYIAPPEMLSCEESQDEITWSRSRYIDYKEVFAAFKLQPYSPTLGSIAPNQPSPYERIHSQAATAWLIFFVLLTVFEFAHLATAKNKVVTRQTISVPANVSFVDITTPSFILDNGSQNVALDFTCPDLNNSWVYVSGELVNDKTGETYPFERSIEYYYGYEDGESWREGGTSADVVISRVPVGLYYINIDGESGSFTTSRTCNIQLAVKEDIPTFSNYFWSVAIITVFPLLLWWLRHTFEVSRWSESDHSPYISVSSCSSCSSD